MKSAHWKVLTRSLLILAIGFAAAASQAANSPFIGDWKLDPSRSKLTDVMKVREITSSKYVFDFGADSPETVVLDGTDQPGVSGTTLSVHVERPDAWTVIRKKDGRVLLTASWQLSQDGSTLTDNFKAVSPNGETSAVDYVYRRKGGGSGFAGTWVSTSEVVNFVYVLQIRPYDHDGLSITNTASQATKSMKLDGKDYPAKGPTATVVAASALRQLDKQTLEVTDKKADGKVYDTQQLRLSPDLRSLTVTIYAAGRDEPNVLIFGRQ